MTQKRWQNKVDNVNEWRDLWTLPEQTSSNLCSSRACCTWDSVNISCKHIWGPRSSRTRVQHREPFPWVLARSLDRELWRRPLPLRSTTPCEECLCICVRRSLERPNALESCRVDKLRSQPSVQRLLQRRICQRVELLDLVRRVSRNTVKKKSRKKFRRTLPHFYLFVNLECGELSRCIWKDSNHLRAISFVKCNERFLLDDVHETAEHAKMFVMRLMCLQKDLDAIERCDSCLRAHSSDACKDSFETH